jgi:hypothetical protein
MCTHNILFIGCTTHIRFWPSIETLYGVFKKKKDEVSSVDYLGGEHTANANQSPPTSTEKDSTELSLYDGKRRLLLWGLFFHSTTSYSYR